MLFRSKLTREIPNWREFETLSREFRPEFWNDPNLGQRRYVKRADEKIADTIAMVLLGRADPRVLLPMMKTIGMSPESLGLAPEAFENLFVKNAAPEPSNKLPGDLTYDEAKNRILGHLSVGVKDPENGMTWKEKFEYQYTRLIDYMNPQREVVKRLGIDFKKGMIDPYVLERTSRGLNDKVTHFFKYGPFDPVTLKSS